MILLAGLLLIQTAAVAQDSKDKKGKKPKKGAPAETKKEEKKEDDKFADITKKCRKHEGLFTIWRDTVTGKSYLEVKTDQFNKEFIYFNHIVDAPVEAGYFRGSYGGSKVVVFRRNFDRLDIVQENTNFYYDPANPISRASNANINDPLLASEKIEGTSKDKSAVLIDADAVFLSEKFQIIKFPMPPGAPPGALGSLSSSKTRVEKISNYPANTDVVVGYVYENGSPQIFSEALEDPRNITIRYQHSLLEMPQNDFRPRQDDPRIGYFSTQVNDMTSMSATPYKDVIHRWHLVKKDPNASLSEPVEPIVYWIENTTPQEWRPLIKEACERWNIAFEKAGFINAVVCKEQPDDATWDAGDIRYNVLRWTSTPSPPFGGYGPSFVNPRTGQILGADIMLELVAITNRVNAQKVFKDAGYLTDEKMSQWQEVFGHDPHFCMAGHLSNQHMAFGTTAVRAMGMGEAIEKEVARQLLYRLIIHEVGHTLGLTHNMRGSTLQSPTDVKNVEKVNKEGIANSIMEYPAFNYQMNPKEQALYCDVTPGIYDLWVIEYGYSPAVEDAQAEATRLSKITARSTDPRLAYGNDADDMRSSGNGIDPDVNIYDLTNDPVAYAAERCELVRALMPKLKDKIVQNGESYEEFLQSYLIAGGEYATQIRVMTRQIGGVHYDRSFAGQVTDKVPLMPVSEARQKAAMAALSKYAFAPNAFDAQFVALNYLLEQRRGFSHFGSNVDPRIHQRLLGMQAECLGHLLHRNVLQRITDSQLYGGTYSLDEYMTELTDAIFKEDLNTKVNTVRQNLQTEYVKRLIQALDVKSGYDNISKAMMVYELKRIRTAVSAATGGDVLTKAHRENLKTMITQALDKN